MTRFQDNVHHFHILLNVDLPRVVTFTCIRGFFPDLEYLKLLQIFGYSLPKSVHVRVNDHVNKGNNKVEYKPDINHLDVGGGWKALVYLEGTKY